MSDLDPLVSHQPFVQRLARGLLLDQHESDDVAQEAMLAALHQPPQRPHALKPWLRRVTQNYARKAMRRRERVARREKAAAQGATVSSAAQDAEQRELQQRVQQALQHLKEPYRTTVVLRFFEGVSAQEIARRTQVPLETVRTRLKRGMSRLRTELENSYRGERPRYLTALVGLATGSGLTDAGRGGQLAAASSGSGAYASTKSVASAPTQSVAHAPTQSVASLSMIAALLFFLLGAIAWWQLDRRGGPPSSTPAALAELVGARPLEAAASNSIAESHRGAVESVPSRERSEASAPASALEVAVRWSDGTPAEGIRARVVDAERAVSLIVQGQEYHWVTDPAGRMLIAGPPRDLAIFIDRTTRVWHFEAGHLAAGGCQIDLPAGADVRVIVPDWSHNNEPIQGAEIYLATARRAVDRGVVVGSTDRNGEFLIRDLSCNRNVGSRATGYRPSLMTWLTCEHSTASYELNAGMNSQLGATLTGRVQDSQGRPVEGAKVAIDYLAPKSGGHRQTRRWHISGPVLQALSDIDGDFVFDAVWADAKTKGPGFMALVEAPGFAPQVQQIHLLPEQENRLDVELQNAVSLSGVVRGPGGDVVAECDVWVQDAASCTLRPPRRSKSDARGCFQFVDLALGKMYLTVQGPGASGALLQKLFADAGESLYQQVQLEVDSAVHGQLLDAQGVPHEGWQVVLSAPYGVEKKVEQVAFSCPPPLEWQDERLPYYSLHAVRTNSSGEFLIPQRLDVDHRLEVFSPDQPRTGVPCYRVEKVRPGVPMILELPADRWPSATLHGILQGFPEVDLEVVTLASDPKCEGVVTAVIDGEYEIGPLCPGEYDVILRGPGMPPQVLTSKVNLTPGGRHDLGVTSWGGRGSLRVQIEGVRDRPYLFLLDESRRLHIPCDFDGTTATLTDLVPGSYDFLIGGWDSTELGCESHPVTIEAGRTANLKIAPEQGRRAWIQFFLPGPEISRQIDCIVAEKLEVSLSRPNGELVWWQPLRRHAKGRFNLEIVLAPGDYRVTATADSGHSVTADVYGPDGADYEKPIQLFLR